MRSTIMAAMLAAIAFTVGEAQAAPKAGSEALVAKAPVAKPPVAKAPDGPAPPLSMPPAVPPGSPTVTLAATGPTPYSAATATFNVTVPNAAAGKARLQITPAAAPTGEAKATWRLTETGAVLPTGAATYEVTRRASAPVALQLEVSGFQIGQEYAAEVLLSDAAGAPISRAPVRVRRGTAALESKNLTGSMASAQRDSVGPVEIVLRLSNDAKEPLAVGLPALVELTRKQGGGTILSDLKARDPKVVCGTTELTTAPVVLAAGAQCQARLTLDAPQPGEYRAKVSVTDVGGTTALADTTANVRAGWRLAAAIALGGTVIGWLLKFWTEKGRPHLVLLQRLYETLAAWKAVDARADKIGLGDVTSRIGGRLAELNRPGGLHEKAGSELDALAVRVRRLEQWIALEEEAVPVSGAQGVKDAAKALRGLLRQSVDPSEAPADDKKILDAVEAYAAAIDAARAGARRGAVAPQTDRDFAVAMPTIGSQDARTLRLVGEAVVGFVTMVLVALSAIQLVWAPNAAWGGLTDYLALFLGAVTAQAGALAVVDAFRNRFPART